MIDLKDAIGDSSSTIDNSRATTVIKYDDRSWQAEFIRYCQNKGPAPGRHPDPNHDWNKRPEVYNF